MSIGLDNNVKLEKLKFWRDVSVHSNRHYIQELKQINLEEYQKAKLLVIKLESLQETITINNKFIEAYNLEITKLGGLNE